MTRAKDSKRTRAPHRACGSRQAVMNQATSDARRRAAAVLEVLAGVRTPAQAAEALAVSLPRYYLIELRAIGGLVAACEPAPRGPQLNAERRVAALEREVAPDTRSGPATGARPRRPADAGLGSARRAAAQWQGRRKAGVLGQASLP